MNNPDYYVKRSVLCFIMFNGAHDDRHTHSAHRSWRINKQQHENSRIEQLFDRIGLMFSEYLAPFGSASKDDDDGNINRNTINDSNDKTIFRLRPYPQRDEVV